MRWILFILLAQFSTLPQAYEAYTQAHCDNITKEREIIRSRLRNGYSTEQGKRLMARFKFLFEELARHCDQPKQAVSTTFITPRYNSNNSSLLNQRLPKMQLHSDSYKNPAKLKAWSRFYKLPKRCRAKAMESSNFVWCSEYRGKQKQLFESQWRGK